ncbi:hypothetical protein AVEN_251388-1 [Araneus ventricosus]|uniref:Uncharacterized protein n=1 Tax=Araneus ventricosus TaxID=182803 RepID=A0A4Y2R6P7_ARAVE|nr:hypothetical protein AVEN_100124-1 [Araneus ventricosus]GBN71432.1 hypothetical protein AVEN_251388-1 [Araneus ventricosus]
MNRRISRRNCELARSEVPKLWYVYPRGYAADQLGQRFLTCELILSGSGRWAYKRFIQATNGKAGRGCGSDLVWLRRWSCGDLAIFDLEFDYENLAL